MLPFLDEKVNFIKYYCSTTSHKFIRFFFALRCIQQLAGYVELSVKTLRFPRVASIFEALRVDATLYLIIRPE